MTCRLASSWETHGWHLLLKLQLLMLLPLYA